MVKPGDPSIRKQEQDLYKQNQGASAAPPGVPCMRETSLFGGVTYTDNLGNEITDPGLIEENQWRFGDGGSASGSSGGQSPSQGGSWGRGRGFGK